MWRNVHPDEGVEDVFVLELQADGEVREQGEVPVRHAVGDRCCYYKVANMIKFGRVTWHLNTWHLKDV